MRTTPLTLYIIALIDNYIDVCGIEEEDSQRDIEEYNRNRIRHCNNTFTIYYTNYIQNISYATLQF